LDDPSAADKLGVLLPIHIQIEIIECETSGWNPNVGFSIRSIDFEITKNPYA